MTAPEHTPEIESGELSVLLERWSGGDQEALQRLIPLIYAQLKRLASLHMRREQHPGSLQTSALVNEAYLRLAGGAAADSRTRAHFLALASRVMRQILIDRVRTRKRAKRGGGAVAISFDEAMIAADQPAAELLDLDEALLELATFDERKAHVVEMRYFGGMEVAEVAQALGVSENTVIRDWALARAWLKRKLTQSR